MADGKLSIHRVKRLASDDPSRAIQTLQMELQQIMKGKCLLRVPVQQPQGQVLWGGGLSSQSRAGTTAFLPALSTGVGPQVVCGSCGVPGLATPKGMPDCVQAPGLPAWSDPSPSTTSLQNSLGHIPTGLW